jgi:hypothetical protein
MTTSQRAHTSLVLPISRIGGDGEAEKSTAVPAPLSLSSSLAIISHLFREMRDEGKVSKEKGTVVRVRTQNLVLSAMSVLFDLFSHYVFSKVNPFSLFVVYA